MLYNYKFKYTDIATHIILIITRAIITSIVVMIALSVGEFGFILQMTRY